MQQEAVRLKVKLKMDKIIGALKARPHLIPEVSQLLEAHGVSFEPDEADLNSSASEAGPATASSPGPRQQSSRGSDFDETTMGKPCGAFRIATHRLGAFRQSTSSTS